MSEYQIDKADAKWLSLALPTKKMRQTCRPQLTLVTVLKCHGIHMAGATDGHRLHAIEVSKEIPNGAYSVDAKTGLLTLDITTSTLDWSVIVTPKKDYPVECTEPSAETMQEARGLKVYQLCGNPGYYADTTIIDQALSIKAPHRIGVPQKTLRVIRIDFTESDKVRFAFVMPIHWQPN